MQANVAVSYFHRKIGPMVYYSYPENGITAEEKMKISDIMDQAFEEGFFTHRFGNLSSMNYYFEIQSDWARGNKEMLMISIIFDQMPSSDVEAIILSWCSGFAQRLKTYKDSFKAFYSAEDIPVAEADFSEIKKYSENLKFWVRELYWNIIEELREKTEEEKWATLLSQTNIFKSIKKLSKGPMALEDLTKWYNTVFNDGKLKEILATLEQQKFIFINTIGQETFVLLVKDVNVIRVPPINLIDLKEDSPELADLAEILINEVRDYFENYQPMVNDSLDLFRLFSNPKIYNEISQLREGPLQKEKIFSMAGDKATKGVLEILETLKEKNIIQELSYGGEQLYILKTDVVFTASFPEYLKKFLTREAKGYIAQAYAPRKIQPVEGSEIGHEIDENEDNAIDGFEKQVEGETKTESSQEPEKKEIQAPKPIQPTVITYQPSETPSEPKNDKKKGKDKKDAEQVLIDQMDEDPYEDKEETQRRISEQLKYLLQGGKSDK